MVNINKGLDSNNKADIDLRIKSFGENQRIKFKTKCFFSLLLAQLTEPLIIILISAAFISAAVETWESTEQTMIDSVGILAAVFICCFVGAGTEYSKEK